MSTFNNKSGKVRYNDKMRANRIAEDKILCRIAIERHMIAYMHVPLELTNLDGTCHMCLYNKAY